MGSGGIVAGCSASVSEKKLFIPYGGYVVRERRYIQLLLLLSRLTPLPTNSP